LQSWKTLFIEFTLYIGLALLWPLDASAIDETGKYMTRGIGSKDGSCGEYVRAETEVRRWFENWFMGYISGINRAKEGKSDYSNGIAADGLTQWIENYCKQNPLTSFSSAVDAMLEEIVRKH
jgi:hypothetical protein